MDESLPSLAILAIGLYLSIQWSVVHPCYRRGSVGGLYLRQRRYGKEVMHIRTRRSVRRQMPQNRFFVLPPSGMIPPNVVVCRAHKSHLVLHRFYVSVKMT